MKVYYKVFEMSSTFEELDKLMDTTNGTFFCMYRYRMLWNLREWEDKITAYNGIIIIDKDLSITIENLPDWLCKIIHDVSDRLKITDKDK